MVFDDVQTVPTNTALTWLTSFTSPPDQSVQFNNSMFSLEISGAMGANGLIVTLYDGAINRPTRYYAYGKTPDNQTDHWYDFSYDSATGTGAEIVGDKIYLHFVDGQRGDEDLIANNSITHTGAQAVVTTTGTTQSAQSGGCSIATTPSKTPRGGDWVMVSLFLGMLALVRRRARRQVQRERVTNIASP
jgi:MYXO-CTERM domain-containing protein